MSQQPLTVSSTDIPSHLVFGGDPADSESFDGLDRGDSLEVPTDDIPAAPTEADPVPDPEPAPAPDFVDPNTDPGVQDPPNTDQTTEPEPETNRRDVRIPKDRFDEVNERRKAAEKRVQELEARLNAPTTESNFDFDAAEQDYMNAVLDGDHAKAQQLRRDIRAQELQMVKQTAAQAAAQAKEATKAELSFEQTVADLEATYPQFNQTSDQYDQSLVDEVLELHKGYLGQGYDPSTAMNKAARLIAKANGLGKPAEPAPTPAPTQKAPPTKPTPEQVQAKLDKAERQPPVQAGNANKTQEQDYTRLTDEEYEALPKETLRRIRGDIF